MTSSLNPMDVHRWFCISGVAFVAAAVCQLIFDVDPIPTPTAGRQAEHRRTGVARSREARLFDWVIRYLTAVLFRSPRLEHVLRRLLNILTRRVLLAGQPFGISARELVTLSLVLGVLFAIFLSVTLPAFAMVAFTVGTALPIFRLQSMEADRLLAATREMPRIMDLLALCMSAGMDLVASLKHVSGSGSGVVFLELRYLVQTLDMGITRRAALQSLSERLPAQEVRDFANAVIQAEIKGASVRDALVQQAAMSRHRRSVRAEESAARAGVMMILPLVLLLGCILIILVGPMVVQGLGM